jgi:hypothetical protein
MPAKRRGRILRRVDKLGAILCAKDEMEKMASEQSAKELRFPGLQACLNGSGDSTSHF